MKFNESREALSISFEPFSSGLVDGNDFSFPLSPGMKEILTQKTALALDLAGTAGLPLCFTEQCEPLDSSVKQAGQ